MGLFDSFFSQKTAEKYLKEGDDLNNSVEYSKRLPLMTK